MRNNKYILIGIILILFGVLLYFTDFLTPYVRPVTHLFLMGSSKGKDVLYFILCGVLFILSQLNLKVNNEKYLKYTLYLAIITFIFGIILELILRLNLGLNWNTIFIAMNPQMASTSIIHSHIFKGVFGHFATMFITLPISINTGASLYAYLPIISNLIIILLPVIFILSIFSIQRQEFYSLIPLCFLLPCLYIGIIDGGLFATPAFFGIFGLYEISRNKFYHNVIAEHVLKRKIANIEEPKFRNEKNFYIKRTLPLILLILLIILRFSIMYIGADESCYEIIIKNPTDNIEINKYYEVLNSVNGTHYYLDHHYNEMELVNELKVILKDKCDYYTVSWNAHSYFY